MQRVRPGVREDRSVAARTLPGLRIREGPGEHKADDGAEGADLRSVQDPPQSRHGAPEQGEVMIPWDSNGNGG